jgi:hypothetical protein
MKNAADKIKAFTDVTCEDAMPDEHWDCAIFRMNQLRQICSNACNVKAEPEASAHPFRQEVTHEQFEDLVRVSFTRQCDDEDFLAFGKRAIFVVITDKYFYLRLAGEAKVNVPRFPYPDEGYRLASPWCAPIMEAYKKGSWCLPENFDADHEWSQAYLNAVLDGGDVIT